MGEVSYDNKCINKCMYYPIVSILFWGFATLDKTITMVGFVGMIALLLYIINLPDQSQYIQNKTSELNLPISAAEQRSITANFLFETVHW